jgi:hypothetical protein
MRSGSLSDWVWESRELSAKVAYANLPGGKPAVLGEAYAGKANPAIEKQIQRAGVRLARILNEALGR